MKKLVLFTYLLFITNLFAQKVDFPAWGDFSVYEKDMKVYEKDVNAHAVVLTEMGYSFVEDGGDYKIITNYYIRIKILDTEGFENGNIELYHLDKETIKDIKAVTTNFLGENKVTTYLSNDKIYSKDYNEKYKIITFTFPDVKVGSILEYSYTKISNNYFTFNNGWIFQKEIPTIKSRFAVKIPGFYNYNISTVGIVKQNVIKNELISNCMSVGGAIADCMFLIVEENNIPAFVEEDYSNSKYNYLKQLKFELQKVNRTDGSQDKVTTDWKEADREFFNEKFGKEYGQTGPLKKILPTEFMNESDELERANKVYNFIKEYFNWNEKYELWKSFNPKKAIESKVGNVTEINSILINALLSVGIKADIALLSTRENGFVTKLYPVISEFNYLVAHVKIGESDYFLDATHPELPFGYLPFECLNSDIRVFPKKSNSYWHTYLPNPLNEVKVTVLSELNENKEIESKVRITSKGYNAIQKREQIKSIGETKYIDNIINKSEEAEISNYKIENLNNIGEFLIETYEISNEIENADANKIYIHPFLTKYIEKNPFNLESRQYPIDFGYARKYNYSFVFTIPEGFKFEEISKTKRAMLPNKGGELVYITEVADNKLQINLSISILNTMYHQDDYKIFKIVFADLLKYQEERFIMVKTK